MAPQRDTIAVIVPVYQAEATLDRCVASLTGQTYRDVEILLVDDGSTDSSPALCDQWAAKDGRITALHQANGGVSAARNAALDHLFAREEGPALLAFADSDDYLDPDLLANLHAALEETGADFVQGGVVTETPGGKVLTRRDVPEALFEGPEACLEGYLDRRGIQVFPVCKLYRRRLWEDLRFPVGVPVGEDAFTTLECCAAARRAALVPGAGYHYVMAPGSLTRGKRTEANLAGYLREAETRMALLEEKFPALAPYGWETWVYRAVQGYGDLDLVEHFDQHSREEWRALFLEKFRLYYPKYRQSAIPSRRGRAAAVNYALFALCPPLQRGLYRAWARRRRGG